MMTNEKRLKDANALKAIFDERYDDAFMQSHTRPNIAWWEGYSAGVNWGRNTIEDTPTVDAVEVVHGKWGILDDGYGCELMCCSVCKSEFYDGDNDTVDCLHNYCPNCGAKMDGDGNERN